MNQGTWTKVFIKFSLFPQIQIDVNTALEIITGRNLAQALGAAAPGASAKSATLQASRSGKNAQAMSGFWVKMK